MDQKQTANADAKASQQQNPQRGQKRPGDNNNAAAPPPNSKQRKIAKQVMEVQVPAGGSESVENALSRTINVEEFVESRSFEITAMEKAVANATEFTGNMRVFQTLPRHMRRRAASYNVKRLPQRLRQRAIDQERDSPSKPQVKKSRKAKRKPGNIHELFGKRSQEGKVWLHTHLWHAKRMHMKNIWGFSLAMHTNDKGQRATFRASQHQCVIHDASYMHCLEFEGEQNEIEMVFSCISDVTFGKVGLSRFSVDGRQGHSFIHEMDKFPDRAIAPFSFFWHPSVEGITKRKLWIWVHPSAGDEVLKTIQIAIEAKAKNGSCKISRLDQELSRFELSGPRAHAIMNAVLAVDESSPFVQLWKDLIHLRTPSSLAPGAILALEVVDPRVNFPPQLANRNPDIPSDSAKVLHDRIVQWPSGTSVSTIYDLESRRRVEISQPKEGEINRTKSNINMGLPAILQKATFPILLIQRQSSIHHSNGKVTAEVLAGWDIVAPSCWAVSLWKSFTFCGARAIGIEDRRNIYFETGIPSFPEDYPESQAHVEWAQQIGAELKQVWEKKPKAKRINYEKFGIQSPFESIFAKLLEGTSENDALSSTGPVTVLHSPLVVNHLRQLMLSNESMDGLRTALLSTKSSLPNSINLNNSFVRLRLSMMRKGAPAERSIIYIASSEEYTYWMDRIRKSKSDDDDMDFTKPPEDPSFMTQLVDKFPAESRRIGYVTAGGFSLATGSGSALGCCILRGVCESIWTSKREKREKTNVLLVRDLAARVCWPATFEMIA
ncbi:hypothetical protein HDU76_005050 [Blyttiomyces sp. JEL0837]|nr:hypothetical protein HDU76_005050 [Blyttiomyces sp. JEL0837]